MTQGSCIHNNHSSHALLPPLVTSQHYVSLTSITIILIIINFLLASPRLCNPWCDMISRNKVQPDNKLWSTLKLSSSINPSFFLFLSASSISGYYVLSLLEAHYLLSSLIMLLFICSMINLLSRVIVASISQMLAMIVSMFDAHD